MGREDQVEELEVLESIFPDELTKLEDNEFRIAIKLDLPDEVIAATKPPAGDDDDGDDDEYEPPVMLLTVRYPEDYPDKEPHLELAPPQDQRQPQNPYFSVADDKDQLLAGLRETIDENLGMAMVFTLVSALKDAAEQLVLSRHEAAQKMREEAALAAEREENKKFHGTPVTPETFVKWQTAFLQEMAEKRRRDEEQQAAELAKKGGGGARSGGGVGSKDGQKLTGRQLWERGLAGKGEDDEDAAEADEGDEAPTDGVQKLKIEA